MARSAVEDFFTRTFFLLAKTPIATQRSPTTKYTSKSIFKVSGGVKFIKIRTKTRELRWSGDLCQLGDLCHRVQSRHPCPNLFACTVACMYSHRCTGGCVLTVCANKKKKKKFRVLSLFTSRLHQPPRDAVMCVDNAATVDRQRVFRKWEAVDVLPLQQTIWFA